MTVCIGVVCQGGEAVVVAADKMVTFGSPMNLQTEPPSLNKITKLTEECVLLFSGAVPDGEELISTSLPKIDAAPRQPVSKIAETVKAAYVELRKKRVEEAILRPLLGADFGQFQALVAQSSASQILQQVMAMISQHNMQLDVLIAGTDDSGGHLLVATNPGQLLPVDTTGFAAIGTGGLHAAVRLSLGQHSRVASLMDAVYNVYEAKKAAEVAPGVGKLTDMAVVSGGKITFAASALFDVLEKVHKEKPSLSDSDRSELEKTCKDWLKNAK
jgi:hypothetical protein